MRAAVLHGREEIRIQAFVPPPLQPGEVRLSIKAALTCGTDLKVYRRGYHARMLTPPCPFGHELAGVITEVHPETSGWSIGARVVPANSAPCLSCHPCRIGQPNLCDDLLFLNGAYAESIVIPARIVSRNLLPIPAHVSFAEAALTEPLACVVQGLRDLQLKSTEHLLVLGAGPIGLMTVALARQAGARVTVIGRNDARLKKALRLGAEVALENQSADGVDHPELAGQLFDAVFEAVGKPSLWEAAVRLVRKGGRVNFFGGCPAGTVVQLDTSRIHYSSLTLLASFHHTPETIRQALAHITHGTVRGTDFIDDEVFLDEVPELFARMTRSNASVKTLIKNHPSTPGTPPSDCHHA